MSSDKRSFFAVSETAVFDWLRWLGISCVASMFCAASLADGTIAVQTSNSQPYEARKAVEEIVIEAENAGKQSELGQSTFELSGDELVQKLGATLGETLADEPGVHNASYGPGVGIPVLRGLSGVRVRLSEDGIGAWDASSISPDHATAIEPVIAESIQVIKGPATVMHGNNAIGGTVEVVHNRIPESLAGESFAAVIEVRKEIENDHDRESYVGKVKGEIGKVAIQVDGFTRRSGDMSIPELAIQEQAIGEIFGISNSDNTFGTVLNTGSDSDSASAALSFVDDSFFIGVSSTTIDNQYGIPPGAHNEPADSPGHSHTHPVGGNIVLQSRVRIDLEQERHIFKFGKNVSGKFFEDIRFTLGNVKYEHREFERNPETDETIGGTRFSNDVVEARFEAQHHLYRVANAGHRGKFGIQWVDREFEAINERLAGIADFIPPTDMQSIGVFAYEEFPWSRGSIELGARYEWQEIKQLEPTAPVLPSLVRFLHSPLNYRTHTISAALSYDVSDSNRLVFNLNSAQRAPEIQELLSLGAHLATRSYDVGLLFDRDRGGPPESEKFNGLELRWELNGRLGEMMTSLFYTHAEDFIYQRKRERLGLFDFADLQFRGTCVRLEECLAVYDYTQDDVTLKGYEWQWTFPEVGFLGGDFQVELFADHVRGKIESSM